jgi:tetratricopeptide (TPR) repeat protein
MKDHRQKRACCFAALSVLLLFFVVDALAQEIPEEARRYIVRGVAAIEMAKTQADYILAAEEFEKAAKLAPDYPDVYYNLGNVQSKIGDLPSAIKSFRRYLELAPKSPDASKVREEIYKLEYRLDRQKLTATVTGTWTTSGKKKFKLVLDGSRIQIKRDEQQGDEDTLTIKSMGTHKGYMTDVPLVFLGIMSGNSISGQFINPAGKYSGHCELPERKGNFEGTIDIDAGEMRIVYTRVLFEYEMKFKSFLSDQLVCRQTNQQEQPGYVLELKRDR